ncbi:MAG: hypothetical protein IPJ07_05415 [Acidobacteria bacterium]|nr:hypothetical protein [Acidobacteriota bacterium]
MPCRSSKLLSIGVLLAVVFGFAASLSPVKADKTPTAEEIVEKTILIYGSRLALYGVQRNGIIRSLVKFFSPTGTREGKSAIKFIRKEKMKDDLSMIQLEMPDMKYSIGFDGKDLWTILDGEVRQASEQEISLVPYETQVFLNGTLVEERKVVEAVFNVQLEEKAFKSENAEKPAAASTPDKNL